MRKRLKLAASVKPVHHIACTKGQSTVEFALITAGLLCIALALGLLWQVLSEGLFVEHALTAASHHVQGAALGAIGDVFLY